MPARVVSNRMVGTETLIAATTRPVWSRTGTATHRTPRAVFVKDSDLDAVSPSHFIFPGQRVSGLFGPVRLFVRM